MAALLERLYSPDAGSITLAGQDIRGFTRTEWCAALAAVSQEPVLFPASIAYNIGGWAAERRCPALPRTRQGWWLGMGERGVGGLTCPAVHRASCCPATR